MRKDLANPYSLRLGKIKPKLEVVAHQKDIALSSLIRRILSAYLKKLQ